MSLVVGVDLLADAFAVVVQGDTPAKLAEVLDVAHAFAGLANFLVAFRAAVPAVKERTLVSEVPVVVNPLGLGDDSGCGSSAFSSNHGHEANGTQHSKQANRHLLACGKLVAFVFFPRHSRAGKIVFAGSPMLLLPGDKDFELRLLWS